MRKQYRPSSLRRPALPGLPVAANSRPPASFRKATTAEGFADCANHPVWVVWRSDIDRFWNMIREAS